MVAGFIQYSTSASLSSIVCIPKKSDGIHVTVNNQNLNKVNIIPQIAITRVEKVLDTIGGGSVSSIFNLFSGFTGLTINLDTTLLTAFSTLPGLVR